MNNASSIWTDLKIFLKDILFPSVFELFVDGLIRLWGFVSFESFLEFQKFFWGIVIPAVVSLIFLCQVCSFKTVKSWEFWVCFWVSVFLWRLFDKNVEKRISLKQEGSWGWKVVLKTILFWFVLGVFFYESRLLFVGFEKIELNCENLYFVFWVYASFVFWKKKEKKNET